MEDKRSFKVVGLKSGTQGVKGGLKSMPCYEGRYISHTPRGAASKAFSEHCNAKNIRGQCTMVVMIQETTQGSKHKVYQYRAKRKRVDKKVTRSGKKLTFKYENNLRSLRKKPVRRLSQKCKKSGVSKRRKSKLRRLHRRQSAKKSSRKGSKKGSKKRSTKKRA